MVELITCTKFKLTTVAFNTLVGGGVANFNTGLSSYKSTQNVITQIM